MRRIAFAIAVLAVCLLASCMTYNTTLLVVPEEGVETSARVSGTLGARSDGGLQMVAGTDYFDQTNVEFMVSLASIDEASHDFTETNIALYGGNFEKGDWTLIDRWDSQVFKRDEQKKANAAIIANTILGTLFVIDAILNPDNTEFYFEYPAYPYYHHYGRHGYWYSYGPGFTVSGSGAIGAGFMALSTIESNIVLSQLSEMYQAELDRSMLQSTVITPAKAAVGTVTFTDIPKHPDYKLVYNDGTSDMQFTFSRSDREEILHPWRDKSYTQLAVNYGYTFGTRRNSVTFSLLAPKYLGGFFGVSFYPPIGDLPMKGTAGGLFGLNWKVAPHTWLQAGLEIYDIDDTDDIGLLALAGFNFCFNWISLYGGAVYDVNAKALHAETALGVSF